MVHALAAMTIIAKWLTVEVIFLFNDASQIVGALGCVTKRLQQ
jgi:hypothetical protein